MDRSSNRPRRARRVAVLAILGAATGALVAARPSAPRAFRVCADPNNLPFSNARQEGFENKIAALFARDLGATVRYDWLAENRGFARKTLKTGACDVIMGVPARYDPVLTTRPYYRSTYVFVYRKSHGWHITSLDDPLLRRVRIGIHVVGDDYLNPPGAQALAARGIIDNVKGYRLVDDYATPNPPSHLVDAVARGDVDVAIVWGPFAGYFAPREHVPLALSPVVPSIDASGERFAFDIAMGVRHGDRALAATLDSLIAREQPAIRRILDQYGVPHAPQADTTLSTTEP
jgi:mxaJ protein